MYFETAENIGIYFADVGGATNPSINFTWPKLQNMRSSKKIFNISFNTYCFLT